MKLLIRSHLLRKSLTKRLFLCSLRIADFDSTPEQISLTMVLRYKVSSFYFFATVKSFPEDCLFLAQLLSNYFSYFYKKLLGIRKYWKNIKIRLKQGLVLSLPSKNKIFVIAVKNYAKSDIKVVCSCTILRGFFILSQIIFQDCGFSVNIKSFDIKQIFYLFLCIFFLIFI